MQHRVQTDLEAKQIFESSFSGFESPEGLCIGFGTTVGNGIEGWAPNAIFIDTNAAQGAGVFTNTGTKTAATFTEIADAGVAGGFVMNDSATIALGSDSDVTMAWTGSAVEVFPTTDDTGAFNFGDGTTDIDVQIFLGTSTEYVLFDVGASNVRFNVPIRVDNNTGAIAASGLLIGGGTTADPIASSVANDLFIELRCQTTATSGDNRLLYMRYQMNGINATGGECIRAFTKLDAACGTVRGAHISLDIDDSPAGSVTGLGVGVDAQLLVGNAALPAGGTYFAGQSQIHSAGSSSDISAVTAHAIHSFSASGDATGIATVLNALAFVGSTGSGKMILNTNSTGATESNGSIRVLVDEGSGYVVRHLRYWDAQNS